MIKRVAIALLLVVACGERAKHIVTDATPGDVATDTLGTQMIDAPAGAVTISVKRLGAPVMGVAVFFQDPAHQVISSVVTNMDGVAFAQMPNGGFVTALEHLGSGLDELTTFAAVESGDMLRLDYTPPGSKTLRPINLRWTNDGMGGNGYLVTSSCTPTEEPYGFETGQPTSPAPNNEMLLVGCDDGMADFLVRSMVDGEPTGRALYVQNVVLPTPVAPQHWDADPTPPLQTIQLSGSFEPLDMHTLTFTNIPTHVTWIGGTRRVSLDRPVYQLTDGDDPNNLRTAEITMRLPQLPASVVTGTSVHSAMGQHGEQVILEWGASATSYGLDVGAALLPPYDSAPAFSIATRELTWTERPANPQPNIVRSRITIYRDDIPSGRSWGWRMIAPRTGTKVTYPQLPVVGFDFNPTEGDAVAISELTTAQLPGGYADWRETGFGDPLRAISGASGRIVVQLLRFEEPIEPEL